MSVRKQDTELSASLEGKGKGEARSGWKDGCGLRVQSTGVGCMGSVGVGTVLQVGRDSDGQLVYKGEKLATVTFSG